MSRAMVSMAAILSMVIFPGCGPSVPELKTAEHYYGEGKKALDKKRCFKAVEEFQRVVTNFPGSALVPDAQYYLAESFYCQKDFVQAVFEYERLLNTYPSSEWVDESQFKIAEAYFRQLRRAELDQHETVQALANFRRFIDDNPDSELIPEARQKITECRTLLAKKRFLAARLYHKQKHYGAALITYRDVMRDFPDTPYYWESLAHLGEIALVQGNPEEARQHWEEVIRDSEDEKLRARVQKLLMELDGPAEE